MCKRNLLKTTGVIFLLFFSSYCSASGLSVGVGLQYAGVGVKKTLHYNYISPYASIGAGISLGAESSFGLPERFALGANIYLTPFFYMAGNAHVSYAPNGLKNDGWRFSLEAGKSASGSAGKKNDVYMLSVARSF